MDKKKRKKWINIIVCIVLALVLAFFAFGFLGKMRERGPRIPEQQQGIGQQQPPRKFSIFRGKEEPPMRFQAAINIEPTAENIQ